MALQVELSRLRAAGRGEPMARRLPGPQVVQAAQLEPQASQPPVARPRDGQQEREPAERKPELAGRVEPRPVQAWPAEPRLLASAEPLAARDAPVAQPQLPSSA